MLLINIVNQLLINGLIDIFLVYRTCTCAVIQCCSVLIVGHVNCITPGSKDNILDWVNARLI